MFVLRSHKNYPIVSDVLYDYYEEISEAMKNIDVNDEVKYQFTSLIKRISAE